MSNSEYWSKRFEQLELSQLQNVDKFNDILNEEYDKALASIQKEINNWFVRFAVNNQVSLKEAKKLLNSDELKELKWNIDDYIKYGEENGLDLIWRRELENASAKVHISRLEALQMQIQQEVEKLGYNQSLETKEFLIDTYQNNYYHTAYEIQKGINSAFIIQALDTNIIKKVISKPWTPDEFTFSDRIWKNKKELINSLHTDLTQMLIRGDSPDKLISKIAKEFNTSKNKAGRLVMTESAFFGSASRKDCFNDLDVKKYEIVATLDIHTSEICRGLDGKVYDMKDYQEGVTAPPFHPWCRTTTAPWFADESKYVQRAARGIDGKTYYIPANMKYNEWYETYINSSINKKQEFEFQQKSNKNYNKDYEQYIKYKQKLKNDFTQSFEDFQKMKYNNLNEYNDIKYTYRLKEHYDLVVEKGELSVLVDFNTYKNIDKQVQKKLIGQVTKNGIEIKSYSKHFIDRICGSIEEKREGVNIKDILDTINNSEDFKMSKKNNSIKIIGKNNIVSINPKTGNLIQTNPYSKEE